jgi:hypothetical protein
VIPPIPLPKRSATFTAGTLGAARPTTTNWFGSETTVSIAGGPTDTVAVAVAGVVTPETEAVSVCSPR